ncbi:MAG: hypothetical protein IJU66_03855 [Oscillospiraceae bacterium]|nr:hypothetical protein [Oscillospiraceae bacterium]
MKHGILCLSLALALAGCAARETGERAESLQARYAAVPACEAAAVVSVERGEERCDYALSYAREEGGAARVTVSEPEALRGISAVIRDDDSLTLEYDGMVLDAGSLSPEICAANAVSIVLRAVGEGCVCERSVEPCADVPDALRLCFETEHAGGALRVAVFFDAQDEPLAAEIRKNNRVLLYLEFTDFRFCDTIGEG